MNRKIESVSGKGETSYSCANAHISCCLVRFSQRLRVSSSKSKATLEIWEKAHPKPEATLKDVADHVDHIAKVAGVDHVGVGADFLGAPGPKGFEDVSRYPDLLIELMRRGWSDGDIAKLAGENVLRVMDAAKKIAVEMKSEPPGNAFQEELDKRSNGHP